MVTEMDDQAGGVAGVAGVAGAMGPASVGVVGATGGMQSVRGMSRDRWGDIYSNVPVKRMVALYDYDPQELSPNVDAEVSVALIGSLLFTPL